MVKVLLPGALVPATPPPNADIVVTHNVCTDDDGEVVLEAITTMMGHDADDSIQVKWDPETGKVMRKAAGE